MKSRVLVALVVVCVVLLVSVSLGDAKRNRKSKSSDVVAGRDYSKRMSKLIHAHGLYKRGESDCPNSCSSHGHCSEGTCECYEGWVALDCSIADVAVNFGQTYNDAVARQQWKFYHVSTPQGLAALSVQANQTSNGGDCDLYVQYNDFPTKSSFYAMDNSLDQNMAVSVTHPAAGTWYAGIYGFQSCTFSILIDSNLNACDCNGHGTCNGVSNCTCDSGYYGNKCQFELKTLQENVPLADSVVVHTWKYYMFPTAKHNNLYVVINQTAGGDSDLYVKYGKFPTFSDYDAKDISLSTNYVTLVNNVLVGTYYIGIFGYSNSSYRITVKVSDECANQCSHHGTCSGDACVCSSGFSGSYCETYVPQLALDTVVSGFVYPGSWNYFHASAVSENSLHIKVMQTQGGDCDLFVRGGQIPQRFAYDYLDVGFGANSSITIQNPGSTVWYIGVLGFKTCSFDITAYLEASKDCEPHCGSFGQCTNGRCVCQAGWTGQACDSKLITVSSSDAISDSVAPNNWVYYKLDNSTSSVVNVYLIVTNPESAGLLQLYVASGAIPTNRDYTNTDSRQIHLSNPTKDSYDYFIGVYASVNGPSDTDPIPYKLAVYQTPF